jgi:hypothetical protein
MLAESQADSGTKLIVENKASSASQLSRPGLELRDHSRSQAVRVRLVLKIAVNFRPAFMFEYLDRILPEWLQGNQ